MMIVDSGDKQQSPRDPHYDCPKRMGLGMIGKTTRTVRPYSGGPKAVKRVENGDHQTASADFPYTQGFDAKVTPAFV